MHQPSVHWKKKSIKLPSKMTGKPKYSAPQAHPEGVSLAFGMSWPRMVWSFGDDAFIFSVDTCIHRMQIRYLESNLKNLLIMTIWM